MRKVIQVGRPIHFRPKSVKVSACGRTGIPEEFLAYDPRDCECLLCLKTRDYLLAMGKIRVTDD